MKHLKTYENYDEDGWIIDINDIIQTKLINTLSDIRDEVKAGDIVIGIWFVGGFDTYLLKVEDGGEELGISTDDTWYGLNDAWGVFSYEEYKKLDPYFEDKLEMSGELKKFNL